MTALNVAALADFVRREQRAAEAASEAVSQLSDGALVALGHIITGLTITQRTGTVLRMSCRENYSRFREGEPARLVCGDARFNATVQHLGEGGLSLTFEAGKLPASLPAGPWTASAEDVDLSRSILQALDKLQSGALGWGFFKLLSGEKRLTSTNAVPRNLASVEGVYAELVQDAGRRLDESQYESFLACLASPPAFAVQGPPGTGKTMLLAFVAEALARLGQRCVIVALTHQAVNNALSTLHALFPQRPVAKLGDRQHLESLSSDIPALTGLTKQQELDKDLVVGLTYMSAVHRLMLSSTGLIPNVLIIDEAGQLPLAQDAFAGLCGAGSVLLFGDDMQMPPVFEADMGEDPPATSVFARFRSEQPSAFRALTTTYRLNSQLCDAIGSTFYADARSALLVPSETAATRHLSVDLRAIQSRSAREALAIEDSLVWLQVPGRSSTQYNKQEADLAAEIVAVCIASGLSPNDVAVVTPFRRQAVLIRNLLSASLALNHRLPIVDTVERVQGLTVEAVIVSMCASEPDYVASVAEFLYAPHRMNVSISRARTKAIVLSAPETFAVVPASYGALVGRSRCRSLLEKCAIVRA